MTEGVRHLMEGIRLRTETCCVYWSHGRQGQGRPSSKEGRVWSGQETRHLGKRPDGKEVVVKPKGEERWWLGGRRERMKDE